MSDLVRSISYQPHQGPILSSDKRTIFFGGGVGSGKTHVGRSWTIKKMIQDTPSGALGLIAANSYTQLFDVTLRDLFAQMDEIGMPHQPAELPLSYGPFLLRGWVGDHWADVLCRSLERIDLVAGLNLVWAWQDEVWSSSRETLQVVRARMRKKGGRQQALYTSTLGNPGEFLHEMMVTKFRPTVRRGSSADEWWMEESERQLVVYAKSSANKYLDEEYLEDLAQVYDDRGYARMVDAQWVTLVTNQVYWNFSEARNVTDEAEFDPNLPIYWSHDFNIGAGKPMSSVLYQMKRGKSPSGAIRLEMHIFDEIIVDGMDTPETVEEMLQIGHEDGGTWLEACNAGSSLSQKVLVRGDYAGLSSDTRSGTNDFEILAAAGFKNQDVRVPPRLRDQHLAMNGHFKSKSGDVTIYVHPRARGVIAGFINTTLKKGSRYIEDDSFKFQHVAKAATYGALVDLPRPPSMSRQATVHDMGGY